MRPIIGRAAGREAEAFAMRERGHLLAYGGTFGGVNLSHDEPVALFGLSDNLSPRINNQTMAVGVAAVFMFADLRGGNDITAGFNRPCPQ